MNEKQPLPSLARNLELKVRCSANDLARFRQHVQALVPAPVFLHQVDTYFAVPRGRLKIRETTPEDEPSRVELVAYHRPHRSGPRWSAYRRVPLDPVSTSAMTAALTETVRFLTRIEKRCTARWIGDTRIHLDDVDGLGCFVESETRATGRATEEAESEFEGVVRLLGLSELETIAGSYSDLMINALADHRRQEGEPG